MLSRRKLLGFALCSAMILGSAGAAGAVDWCTKRIDHERHELDRAIVRHGYWSRQAEHERRELSRLRNECRRG